MLKNIAIVTVMVESLEITELVYQNELSYKLIHRGKVSNKMASGWDAKNVAGRPFILMGPTNNEAVYLRFIESEKFDKNFRSLKTYGWNAIEILVKDTEQLFLKLKVNTLELLENQSILAMKKASKLCRSWVPPMS